MRWFLNIRVISTRVDFQLGIFTPSLARAERSIISLNFGCSRACIGYKEKHYHYNLTMLKKYSLPDPWQQAIQSQPDEKPCQYMEQLIP